MKRLFPAGSAFAASLPHLRHREPKAAASISEMHTGHDRIEHICPMAGLRVAHTDEAPPAGLN